MWAASYWPGPKADWAANYWPKSGKSGFVPPPPSVGGASTYLPILGIGIAFGLVVLASFAM